MLCSNGYSEKIEKFVREKNMILNGRHKSIFGKLSDLLGRRIVYIQSPHKELPDAYSLLANLGQRRNLCIKRIKADYLFMFDADAKLLDKDMFAVIKAELEKTPKGLCIYKVIHDVGLLPQFPIGYGKIDLLNYCAKASLAKKVGYPTAVTNRDQPANDYWFFDRLYKATNGEYLFIDQVFGRHNGNNTYINLLKLL
jgi:hypothetical protein